MNTKCLRLGLLLLIACLHITRSEVVVGQVPHRQAEEKGSYSESFELTPHRVYSSSLFKATTWTSGEFVFSTLHKTGESIDGSLPIVVFGSGPSLNDYGKTAFIAREQSGVHGRLFVENWGATEINLPTPLEKGIGECLHINNNGQTAFRDYTTDGLFTFLTRLDVPTEGPLIAVGTYTSYWTTPFEYVLPWPGLNNNGLTVVGADLKTGGTVLAARADGTSDHFMSPPLSGFPDFWPKISDINRTIVRGGAAANAPIVLFMEETFDVGQAWGLASSPEFSSLGEKPAISDDGFLSVFHGYHATAGPGLYACHIDPTPVGWRFRVASISSGDINRPMGVNRIDPECGNQYRLVWVAEESGLLGLNVCDIDVSDPSAPVLLAQQTILREGDSLGGYSGVVADIGIYDPVNNHGEILFWMRTTTGEQALVKAQPAGTTVIAHGYCGAGPDGSLEEDQGWTLSLGEAIAERLGSGQVYTIVHGEVSHQTAYSVGDGGETIIAFDWIDESDRPVFGYAEGAADALVAHLLQGAIDGLWSLDHLHFIGHSRGTVVLSEAIQRLAMYSDPTQGLIPEDLKIDQEIHYTMFDPYPWDKLIGEGQGWVYGSAGDHSVNYPRNSVRGVICWDNLAFAENYWQNGTGVWNLKGWPNPLGCANPGGTNNFHLDRLSEDGGHSEVHAWYHGTVDNDATGDSGSPNSITIDPAWYDPPESRQEWGFNWSLRAGKTNPNTIALPASIQWFDDSSLSPTQVFNGDFQMYDDGTGVTIFGFPISPRPREFPGWAHQGGGGECRHLWGNRWIRLESDKVSYAHNWLYVPENAENLHLRLEIEEVRAANGGALLVELIDHAGSSHTIGSVPLLHATNWERILVPIPETHRGSARILKFALDADAQVNSTVCIDDVGFSPARYTLVASGPSDLGENGYPERSGSTYSGYPCLRLQAYDEFGNHTGTISDSTYVEEIPGSRYYCGRDSLGMLVSESLKLPETEPGQSQDLFFSSNGFTGSVDVVIEDVTSKTNIIKWSDIEVGPLSAATTVWSNQATEWQLMVDQDGDGEYELTLDPDVLVGITDHGGSMPSEHDLVLFPSYPNPFNPAVTIRFAVRRAGIARLSVHDVEGRLVCLVIDEPKPAGEHTAVWYGRDASGRMVASGVYLVRLEYGGQVLTQKIALLK